MEEKINELSNRQTLDDCNEVNKSKDVIIDLIITIGNIFPKAESIFFLKENEILKSYLTKRFNL